jgi:hypothetical protein
MLAICSAPYKIMANTLKTATYAGLFAVSLIPAAFGQDTGIATDLKPLESAPVLARKVVDMGTHKVTYIRITPPQLPAVPQPPPPPVTQPTPEQLAAEEARAAKTYEQLMVSVTVYPATATTPLVADLNWWHEGKRYQAWSNVDFRLLTQISQVETETHIFAWFPMVGEGSVEEIPAEQRPAGLSLFTAADTAPLYYVEGTEEDMAAVAGTLAGLDYFHAYYQLHKPRLAEEYAQLMALIAERQAELEKNPPKPVDTTIHFWRAPAPASTP